MSHMERAVKDVSLGLAMVCFALGFFLGIAMLCDWLFGAPPLKEEETKIMLRVLTILFGLSTGLFHRIAFQDYLRHRRELRERG